MGDVLWELGFGTASGNNDGKWPTQSLMRSVEFFCFLFSVAQLVIVYMYADADTPADADERVESVLLYPNKWCRLPALVVNPQPTRLLALHRAGCSAHRQHIMAAAVVSRMLHTVGLHVVSERAPAGVRIDLGSTGRKLRVAERGIWAF
jgi:hypothetical protein